VRGFCFAFLEVKYLCPLLVLYSDADAPLSDRRPAKVDLLTRLACAGKSFSLANPLARAHFDSHLAARDGGVFGRLKLDIFVFQTGPARCSFRYDQIPVKGRGQGKTQIGCRSHR